MIVIEIIGDLMWALYFVICCMYNTGHSHPNLNATVHGGGAQNVTHSGGDSLKEKCQYLVLSMHIVPIPSYFPRLYQLLKEQIDVTKVIITDDKRILLSFMNALWNKNNFRSIVSKTRGFDEIFTA